MRNTLSTLFGRIVEDANGCWLWTGATIGIGYGVAGYETRQQVVHRIFYEQLIGPLAEGHHLHHLCGQPHCANPLHLQEVLPEEHAQHHNPPKICCPAGHPYEGDNLYVSPKGQRFCRACDAVKHRRQRRERAAKKRGGCR